MKNEDSNILTEYFEYLINGLKIIISEYPIMIGIFLFVIGIKSYLKMIEKEPINYKTRPANSKTINEARMRNIS